jgi:hypothetical protein
LESNGYRGDEKKRLGRGALLCVGGETRLQQGLKVEYFQIKKKWKRKESYVELRTEKNQ